MNKKKLFNLFILLFIMGFVLPLNTKALTFTDCKGVNHEVDSETSAIDYFYFNKDSYSNDTINNYLIFATYPSSGYTFKFYGVTCSDSNFYVSYNSGNSYRFKAYNGSNCSLIYKYISCDNNFSCTLNNPNAPTYISYTNNSDSLLLNPNIYSTTSFENISFNASTYNEQSILTKYNCNSSVVPEPTEEVNMFDVVSTFLIQFINILPFMIPFILIMNLICRMLFNERS